jgi:hypothetical protein
MNNYLDIINITEDLKVFSSLEEIAFKYNVSLEDLDDFIKQETGFIDCISYKNHIQQTQRILIKHTLFNYALGGDKKLLMFIAKNYLPENKPKQIKISTENTMEQETFDGLTYSDLREYI